MRFYDIVITDPLGKAAPIRYSSVDDKGFFKPGALNVEFDIPVTAIGAPSSGAYVRIWGVSIETIGQAADLNNRFISVSAGMSKGLPLANQQQQGLLVEGYIYQSFGNWQDTQQSLDLIIYAGLGGNINPKNLAIEWKEGQPLAEAITNTVQAVFPDYSVDVSGISQKLVVPETQPGYYATMPQFCSWIKTISQSINVGTTSGQEYSGVDIVLRGKTLYAFDNHGSTPLFPKEIKFADLIGQPVWMGVNTIQFNCVMRGDLAVGDFITMPKAQVTTSSQSFSQFRNRSIFQGTFKIVGEGLIRHVGNYRQPIGTAWITTVNAVAVDAAPVLPTGSDVTSLGEFTA